MAPKLKTYEATVVWYHDLEDFLEEIYGVRPDIQGGELSNNSYLEFEVRTFETDSDMGQELQNWIDDGAPYLDEEIVGYDLAKRKLLPEGKYLITVWW